MYLAIDPGHTSGWATFDDKGVVVAYGQFHMSNLMRELKSLIKPDVKAVIVEDYVNYGWKQQKRWSRNDTSKIIGSIEAVASIYDVPVHLQPANVKGIGYKWAGLGEAPSNHAISHQFDAIAHGVYWLQQNGVRLPSVPKEN